MCAVLYVAGRPKSLGSAIVALVKERIERIENSLLVYAGGI
jgi:hypothetical protein